MFIDDAPLNVAAADAVGLVAVHFQDAASLRRVLVGAGLLPEAGPADPSVSG
jgi:hypothetical protein